MSPNSDDIEANAGCAPWAGTNPRQSSVADQASLVGAASNNSDFSELDKALQHVRDSVEAHSQQSNAPKGPRTATNPMLKRHHSVPHGPEPRIVENGVNGPISSRTRRATQTKANPSKRYETPNEEEELLSEVLASAHKASKKLDNPKKPIQRSQTDQGPAASYLTPSPSANRNSIGFGQPSQNTPSKPMEISKSRTTKDDTVSKWPTPPDDSDWASSVAASLMATQSLYR
jgi:meiosis induction protein kinase IME2/SME1